MDGAEFGTTHFFIQDSNGHFERRLMNADLPATSGASSVAISDLNGNGLNNVLLVSYGNGMQKSYVGNDGLVIDQLPYAFVILEFDAAKGGLVEVYQQPLVGTFFDSEGNGGHGAIDIAVFDFDNDGDDDILFLLETSDTFSFEFFENKGDLVFTRITEDVFSKFEFNATENFFRHIDIVDLNGDGFDDFVLSGGNHWSNHDLIDLGSFIYINDGGGNFRSLSGNPKYFLDQSILDHFGSPGGVVRTIKFLEHDHDIVRFLLTDGGIGGGGFLDLSITLDL